MPRKNSQASSTSVLDRADATLDLRPGAVVSPETVNVFAEGVSAGAVEGLHLAPLAGRPSGAAIALSIQAWVRNIAYDKDLWVDLRLLDDDSVLHAETLPLFYQDAAEGGGDFFALGTALPAPKPHAGGPTTRTLCYRLYSQMNGQIFTDGTVHTHEVHVVAPAERKAAPAPTAPAQPQAAPKTAPKAAKTTAAVKTPVAKAPAAKAPAAKAPAAKAPIAKPEAPKPTAAPKAAATTAPKAASAKTTAPKTTAPKTATKSSNGTVPPKRKPKATS